MLSKTAIYKAAVFCYDVMVKTGNNGNWFMQTEDRRTAKRKTGDSGEDAACRLLEREGYTIAARNYSCRMGEIDIIAVNPDEKLFAFVEVKTRRSTSFGMPSEAVDRKKQQKLRRCAELYMLRCGIPGGFQPSMDIIEIIRADSGLYGRHLKNAF